MAEIIRMPRLSDTMEEGNIVAWLKKEGDPVKTGDILAEVETDKATMELESYFDGILLYIGIPSGPVAVDGIIAIIGKSGEEFKHLLSNEKVAAPSIISQPVVNNLVAQAETKQPEIQTQAPEPIEASRVKASPLAKSMANEAGISIDQVRATSAPR